MRLLVTFLFALAFLVHSIVGPGFQNLHSPYKVVKMTPDKLKGVEVQYKTVYESAALYPNYQYYQVIHSLYTVHLGERIIGRTNTSLRLYPIHHSFDGIGREIVQIQHGQFRVLEPNAVIALGMFQRLPANTQFVDRPELEPLIIIKKDAEFKIAKVIAH